MRILVVAPQPFYQERGTPIATRLLLEALQAAGHAHDAERVSEAAEIFSRLKAHPWLERAAQLAGDQPRERRAQAHATVTSDIRQDRRTSVRDASS